MNFTIGGLNHLGLVVEDIEKAKWFFGEILGLEITQDRGGLVFLHVGSDVLAIKTPEWAVNHPEHGGESNGKGRAGFQALDHYGFYAPSREEVDNFAAHLKAHNIEIIKGPYDRSDGRSVYFRDPCGNVGEYLYYQRP
jgi:catechol 2,3-dioxygenase-like lactoylglutathione lyase family enzyme